MHLLMSLSKLEAWLLHLIKFSLVSNESPEWDLEPIFALTWHQSALNLSETIVCKFNWLEMEQVLISNLVQHLILQTL